MSSILDSTYPSTELLTLLQTGLSVQKLNKWKLPQSRFLWLDKESKELRWSKNSKLASATWKKVTLGEVKKVSKLSKYRQMKAEHGFTLDTAKKSLIFRTETLEIRDKIVACLMPLLRRSIPDPPQSSLPATEDTENCTTPEPKSESSAVLGDFNRHEGLICSRELFSKTGSAHRQARYQEGSYRAILTRITTTLSSLSPLSKSPSFDELPSTISQILEQQSVEIERLTEDLQREVAEAAKITIIRKKLKALEATQERCAAVEAENEEIRGKIEAQSAINRQLEQKIAHLHPVNYVWTQWTEENVIDAHLDLLRKGFFAYLRQICDESVSQQLSLSPESAPTPGFSERFLLCSQDLSQLTWRTVSPFATKRASISTQEITDVYYCQDDELPGDFPGYRYLTLISPQVTLTLAVDPHSAFYLEAIRAMVARTNHLPYSLSVHDDNLLSRYKVLCDQYESQARHMEQQIKRYKSKLTERIFDLENGLTAQQAVYTTELEQLMEMNDRCMLSALSPDCEQYLKEERIAVLERLRSVNEAIAAELGRKRGSS